LSKETGMKAIRIAAPGGSDVMKLEEIPTPKPGKGELLVKLTAAGLNYIDTYQRSGMYKMPLPFTPGNEGAGHVEAVGEGVTGFKAGDAVAYTGVIGAYAEYTLLPAARAVKVPAGMDLKIAASIMLQGMTAHYLACDSYALRKGDWCLVHAGAGGVGLLLIQMAKMRGANVITTVSTEEKAKLAKEAGADHAILYTKVDFEAETLKIVGDRKVDVVYDAVGKDTFDKGFNVIRRRGTMVLYGASSGPVPPFDLQVLNAKGSLFIQRPSLVHHIFTREELEARAGEVMSWVQAGKLKVRIGHTYPIAQAKQSHDDLEGRKTTGKVLLLP
jgi:NADPH:quinone reductase